MKAKHVPPVIVLQAVSIDHIAIAIKLLGYKAKDRKLFQLLLNPGRTIHMVFV